MSLYQKSVLKKYLSELHQPDIILAYNKFQKVFQNPIKQQNILNSKEEQYQEGFLRELFVDVLGYVLNPDENYNLITEQKNENDNRKADGAILSKSSVLAIIELKSTRTIDLSSIEAQAFAYKNNQKGCEYVITSNFKKLRFYISNAVEYEEFDLFNLSLDNFKVLWICLSSEYLLHNVPYSIKQSSNTEEVNITKKLYADYADFRKALFNDLSAKNELVDGITLFKKTQKLLDRFLFLFFAEDRGLVSPNWTRRILNDWVELKDRFDNYIPLYIRFRKNFDYLNTGIKNKEFEIFAYNGGLFQEDELLDSLEIDDQLLYDGTLRLSNYDFDSEVDVNILGHIFEHSLNDIEEIHAKMESDNLLKVTRRKKDGVFYTPKYITKYIVENTIGKLCNEYKEKEGFIEEDFVFIDIKAAKASKKLSNKREALNRQLTDYREWLLRLKVVDPACGSGAFLNQALEFLISEHNKIDELKAMLLGGSIILSDVENSILENNLYGVDINEEATEIAKLSLWLRTARRGRKLSSLNNNIKCGNSLISDSSIIGNAAFDWQEQFAEVFEDGGFDVVIGNPPYAGRNSSINDAEKHFIRTNYKAYEGKFELYQLFIERCNDLGKANSLISLITPQTWLSIVQATKLRKLLINNAVLEEIIFLGKGVFEDASVDTIIFFINKNKKSEIIKYKTSDNLLNKHLEFVKIPYFSIEGPSFILPITSEAGENQLINKIYSASIPLSEIGKWSDGVKVVGPAKNFAFQDNKFDHTFYPMVSGKDIDRYSIIWRGFFCCRDKAAIEAHHATDIRLRDESVFKQEKRILIRKTGNQIVAALDTQKLYNEQSLFSFALETDDIDIEFVLCVLNSRLATFLLRSNSFSKKDTFPQIRLHWLKEFPIKILDRTRQHQMIEFFNFLQTSHINLFEQQKAFSCLLETKFPKVSNSVKLSKPLLLKPSDFFNELKKFGVVLSIKEEAEWLKYFNEQKSIVDSLLSNINEVEKEIDKAVYGIYDLTPAEILVIEHIEIGDISTDLVEDSFCESQSKASSPN